MTDAPRILIHTSDPAPMLARLAAEWRGVKVKGHAEAVLAALKAL